MLKRVTPHFYILNRRQKRWTPHEFRFIKKSCDKDIFSPLPFDFVRDAITGYYFEEKCITAPCKMIMFNYDLQPNNKKGSLRGVVAVDFKVDNKKQAYILIRVIGCKSIKNTPANTVKQRKNAIMKTGRDMLEWWKEFAVLGNFKYIKLNGMEDVLGFYWKIGWRFLRNPRAQHALSNDFWNKRMESLNAINKLQNKIDPCWIESERSPILSKYFDRFLEGYYSDVKLKTYRSYDDLYDIYGLDGTLKRHHLGLRYHGYTMYWYPEEN